MAKTAVSLRELESRVGEEVGVSPWVEMPQERIDLFAKATEDFQWIHVDPKRAKDSPFGGTIAHGFLTLSLLPMLTDAAFTLSDRTLRRCVEAGQTLGAGFHIHVAEDACDVKHARTRFRKSPVRRLCDLGVLDSQAIAAHCVHVSAADMSCLARHGVNVVHNPQSNCNNAVGIADVAGDRYDRVAMCINDRSTRARSALAHGDRSLGVGPQRQTRCPEEGAFLL